MMSDTLARFGRLDAIDRKELVGTLDQLARMLAWSRSHLAQEKQFVHAAIEACRPGATRTIGEEHLEQLEATEALLDEAAALRSHPTTPAALRLYQHLARFVADSFDHMHAEETQLNPLLWANYRDDQLLEIEQRIQEAMPAAERVQVLRWMTPAITPIERAWRYAQLQQQLTPDAFECALEAARSVLDPRGWNKLCWALRLPAAL